MEKAGFGGEHGFGRTVIEERDGDTLERDTGEQVDGARAEKKNRSHQRHSTGGWVAGCIEVPQYCAAHLHTEASRTTSKDAIFARGRERARSKAKQNKTRQHRKKVGMQTRNTSGRRKENQKKRHARNKLTHGESIS